MNANDVPILITSWNRPNKIDLLIKSLRKIKPTNIYISCDGPKDSSEWDKKMVEQTRKIINQNIDWECTLKKKYNQNNLGCKRNMISSINWIFEKNEMAIILEDDCIPDPYFFEFCYLLLIKYKKDKRIWNINGTNVQDGNIRGEASYYFSKYFHSWGWATWKDRWEEIDEDLKSYEDFRNLEIKKDYFMNKKEEIYWIKIFDNLFYRDKPDSWAYRWFYTCLKNKGLNITPNSNLINNIGFDKEATNTKISIRKKSKNIKYSLSLMSHAKTITINCKADKYTFENSFKISLFRKLIIIFMNPNYYLKKFFSFKIFN